MFLEDATKPASDPAILFGEAILVSMLEVFKPSALDRFDLLDDGHRRITSGEQFTLVGGSERTHEQMTETMIKTFEEMKRRDKRLENIDPRELAEIVHKSTPA